MADKKYYWLKLQRDFFKRHDIRIIEDMKNGKDYVLFYLKLLVESIDHDGNLRFNDTIPYNDTMLATITNTNIDIVRSAMKIFTELKMLEILDDETIFMGEVHKMLGSETKWAEKKRLYRRIEDNVPELSAGCPHDVRQEKELEKELELEKDKESTDAAAPTPPERKRYGEYGWVRLTEKQYDNLLAKLGQAELDRCIKHVDESAQKNGNKNKWKDWNLVIQSCSRERWGVKGSAVDSKPVKDDWGITVTQL